MVIILPIVASRVTKEQINTVNNTELIEENTKIQTISKKSTNGISSLSIR